MGAARAGLIDVLVTDDAAATAALEQRVSKRRSEMSAGKTYRMGRIFGPDGRTLVLPVDHGLTLGRVEGLEDPVGRMDGLLDLPCDGFLMTPGLTRLTTDRFARRDAPARLLTLDTFFREPGETEAGAGLGRLRRAGGQARRRRREALHGLERPEPRARGDDRPDRRGRPPRRGVRACP